MSAIYADVVSRAADRIERDGFYKGAYYKGWDSDHEGVWMVAEIIRARNVPCCTLGAIYAEANVCDKTAVVSALTRCLGLDAWGIPDWNDKPSQRKGRVVAALRRAAKKMNEEK